MGAISSYLSDAKNALLGQNGTSETNGQAASSTAKSNGHPPSLDEAGSPDEIKQKKANATTPDEASPFIQARRQLTEKLKASHEQKQQWMLANMLTGVALILAVSGLLYMATSSRVESYVTVYDAQTGEALRSSMATQELERPDAVVRNHIEQVIRGVRTVYGGPRATADNYEKAFEYISSGSAADNFITSFLQENSPPTQLVGDVQRSVTGLRITPITGSNTWNVAWRERAINAEGIESAQTFQGTVTIEQREPTTAEKVRENPAGIFVKNAMWEQVQGNLELSPTNQDTTQAPLQPSGSSSSGSGASGPATSSNAEQANSQ